MTLLTWQCAHEGISAEIDTSTDVSQDHIYTRLMNKQILANKERTVSVYIDIDAYMYMYVHTHTCTYMLGVNILQYYVDMTLYVQP